jgi:lysophospholipase L1-like esterase
MSLVKRTGMVEHLGSSGNGSTKEAIDFVRAYLTNALTPEQKAQAYSPDRIAAKEKAAMEQRARDWPNLGQYRDANAAITTLPRAVFVGDSLTELWSYADPELFSNGVIGRGISGQTTPQVLLRFMADVVALKPKVVHILCGGNDVAGNTGPTTFRDYQNNVLAMLTLADAHGLRVILGNLAGFDHFAWAPEIDPKPWIQRMNAWIENTARTRGYVLADYRAAFGEIDDARRAAIMPDGVHPNIAGYALMRPVALQALDQAFEQVGA